MWARFVGVKMRGSSKFVIIRVLDGGVGCERAGRSERSMERFGEWRR